MGNSPAFLFRITKCSLLLSLFILVSPAEVHAFSIDKYGFCKDVDKSQYPYRPIDATNIFYDTDKQVCLLITLRDVSAFHTTYTKWFTPHGDFLGTIDVRIEDPKTKGYDFWTDYSCYYLLEPLKEGWGKDAIRKYPGLWKVEFYVDDKLLLEDSFEIKSTAPSTTATTTSTVTPTPNATTTSTSIETIVTTSILTVTTTHREEQATWQSFLSNPLYVVSIILAIGVIALIVTRARRRGGPIYQQSQTPVGYCTNCGAPLRAGTMFCGSCGQGLDEAV